MRYREIVREEIKLDYGDDYDGDDYDDDIKGELTLRKPTGTSLTAQQQQQLALHKQKKTKKNLNQMNANVESAKRNYTIHQITSMETRVLGVFQKVL